MQFWAVPTSDKEVDQLISESRVLLGDRAQVQPTASWNLPARTSDALKTWIALRVLNLRVDQFIYTVNTRAGATSPIVYIPVTSHNIYIYQFNQFHSGTCIEVCAM